MTTSPTTARDEHLAQAKLFAEVARRSERSLDAFEGGDLSRVTLVLWQQAAGYALLAAEAEGESTGDGRRYDERRLERAAGGAEPLKAVLDLLPTPMPGQPDAALIGARVEQIASFTKRLIADLEDSASSARRRLLARYSRRSGAAAVVVAVLVFAGSVLFGPPDLVPSAKRTLSSQLTDCKLGACGLASFHTREEDNPWVAYDFGAPKRLRSIKVENRPDCCLDRAVPLVVEVSNDQRSWTELARIDKVFLNWSADLAAEARYLRLRVLGRNYLHLRNVEIR